MPKFTDYVSLIDADGKLHSFAPKDDAPEWAKGRVGDHVLDEAFAADSDEEEAGEEASDEDAEEEQQLDQRPAAAKAKPELKDTAAAKAASTPDFTKPAPRARK